MVIGGTTGLPLMKKKKNIPEDQGMSILPDKSKLPPQLGGDPTPSLPWEKPKTPQTGSGQDNRQDPIMPKKPGVNTNITINPDKSVTLSTGEQKFVLSDAEYRDYLRTQRKGGTNQPGSVGYEREAQLAANNILRRTNLSARVSEILAERGNVSAEGDVPQVSDLMNSNVGQDQSSLELAGTAISNIKNMVTGGKVNPIIANSKKQNIKTLISDAANIYDSFRSLIRTGKSVSVVQAESAFVDASSSLKNNIDLVKLGADPSIAIRDMKNSVSALSRLESQTKGLGMVDLRFWIDKGAELEASIANEKSVLESLRQELVAAIEQQRMSQMTGGLNEQGM